MKKILLLFYFIALASPLYAADDNVYYARCNIRVLSEFGQSKISWKNWLAASVEIPAGTKIIFARREADKVRDFNGMETEEISEKIRIELEDGRKFNLSGEPQEKYLQKEPPELASLSPEFKDAVKKAEPVKGMTKDHVFMTLCAPAYVMHGTMAAQSTETLSIEDIKKTDIWIYQRKKFGKKFVVEFDAAGHAEKIYWRVI